MANSGKAQKAVVRKLVSDIRFFSEQVKLQSEKMIGISEALSHSWNDPQYEKFRNYMTELCNDLKNGTKELDYCANKLEETEIRGI